MDTGSRRRVYNIETKIIRASKVKSAGSSVAIHFASGREFYRNGGSVISGRQRQIISCASAKFSQTEKKYQCNEQEVLAAVWACRRYRAFLEDKPFILKTDSKALQWLNKVKDERAKLTKYSLLLQEFNYEVIHCPGRKNQLPDHLSRHLSEEETEAVDE